MGTETNYYMDNFGGIDKIYPIDIDDIATFDQIFHSKVYQFTVYSLNVLSVDKEQTQFSEPHKKTSSGNYFDTKLKAVIPKDRQELLRWANESQDKRFLLVMVDNNGIIKVAGTPDEPLQLFADYSPGNIDKLNNYKITFERKMRTRAYFLDALPNEVPPP